MTPHRLLLPAVLLALAGPASAADLPRVSKVDLQPLAAQARRVADALELLGAPLTAAERKALADAAAERTPPTASMRSRPSSTSIAWSPSTFARRREARRPVPVAAEAGPAKPELAEQGWRVFLVKVYNEAASTRSSCAPPAPTPPPLTKRSSGKPDPQVAPVGDIEKRFLDLTMFNGQPLVRDLSGLEVEYRIVQIYCRDAGRKEAALTFGLWREGDKDKPSAASGAYRRRLRLGPGGAGQAARPRRRRQVGARRQADHGGLHHHRRRRPRLPGPDAPPGARLQLPPAGLPRRRRDRRPAAGRLHLQLDARPGVPRRPPHRHGAGPQAARRAGGDVRPEALGPPRRPGLVLRRPSHPRGRLRPLRKPHRGRHARRHDAPRPRRGSQRRLLPQLGAVLVSPEALLRGQGERPVHAGQSAPLRRGSVRFSVEPLRPHLPAAAARPGLPRHEAHQRLAELGPADLPAGPRHRAPSSASPTAAGASTWGRRRSCPTTCCRR